MSVTIQTINVKDSLSSFRTNLNANFAALKNEIALMANIVDIPNSAINVSDINLAKGERAISTEILVVEASGNIHGNFNVSGNSLLGNTVIASGKNLTVTLGNLNVSHANSNVNLGGSVYFDGPIINKDFGDTAIDGSAEASYVSVASNVGLLSVSGKHAMILDFSNYSNVANVNNVNDVKDIKLSQGSVQGQKLTLIINADSSTGKPHRLVDANIASLAEGEFIATSNDNAVVDLIYIGTSWKVLNLYGASVV